MKQNVWPHLLMMSLLLWQPLRANAEVAVGAVTLHLQNYNNAGSANSNKLSTDGTLIANPMVGYTALRYMLFAGENSVGAPMAGLLGRHGVLVYGAYLQQDSPFAAKGISPYRLTNVEDVDMVPVIGLDLHYNALHCMLTPALLLIYVTIP